MNGAEQVLVVILSIALAIFLVLAIIVAIKAIQILSSIKRITTRAEHIAEKADNLGDMFVRSAGPAAIGRFFSNASDSIFGKKNKRRRK